MTTRRSPRAEELLDKAMHLFAERGYGATSVADIQEAAGLTPGSGALYKHFPSKEALLDAGIERFVAEAWARPVVLPPLGRDDLRTILRQVAKGMLQRLEDDRDTFRLAWRDLGPFPDLQRRMLHERVQPGFARVAAWLQDAADRGVVVVDDAEATAAVLLGSIVYFRLMEVMLGDSPGAVGDGRFVDAWVDLAAGLLRPDC
jgi:AcrR family transcriptional regulator